MLETVLWPPMLALLGLVVGSFLNVLIHRLPIRMERQWWADACAIAGDTESHQRVFGGARDDVLCSQAQGALGRLQAMPELGLARPPSRCPACGHRVAWHENIPLLSWALLRGRCSACATPIGVRYPLVEGLTGLLFATIGWRLGAEPQTLLWCLFAAALVALSCIDWDTTLLPDSLTQPLLWAGLGASALGWIDTPLQAAFVGAAAGYTALWAVQNAFKLATGKDGMGQGDFKLFAAIGAWLGWQALLPVLLAASCAGSIVGLVMKFSGSLREGRFVPFGPFLAAGALAVMLIGLPTVLRALGW